MKRKYHIHRGATLLELVVSMSIASLLLTGIGSSMVLASRALPSSSNHLSQTIVSHQLLEKMSGEISVAQTFTLASTNAIEFTVADRNADSLAETIRYEWSGVAGDPLLRKYNLLPAVNLLEHVENFVFYYGVDAPAGGSGSATTDQPFIQFVGINIDGVADEISYAINDTQQFSEYISPDPASLPANTLTWKLDQVVFQAKKKSKNVGVTNVELRNVDGSGRPTSLIEGLLMQESSLTKNWSASTFDFTSAPWLEPNQGLALTFSAVVGTDTDTAAILYQQLAAAPANVKLFISNDAGGIWVQGLSQTMTGLYVYGTARIDSSVGQPAATTKLNIVSIELQIEQGAGLIHSTSTNVLNHPDVTIQ